jgi:hypothetical protein
LFQEKVYHVGKARASFHFGSSSFISQKQPLFIKHFIESDIEKQG